MGLSTGPIPNQINYDNSMQDSIQNDSEDHNQILFDLIKEIDFIAKQNKLKVDV